jgi:hypothetical protein
MVVGALLGLVGSLIPELVKVYKDWSDKKHELDMMQMQIEYADKMAEIRIKEAEALARIELDKAVYDYAKPDIKPTGFFLADVLQAIGSFLNMIVRPIITAMAMGLWLYGLSTGYQFSDWEQEAINCIIVFWFGNRSFQRALGRV